MHVYHSRSAKYCVLGNWEAVTVNVSCQSCCCFFLSAALSDPFQNVTISVPEKTAGRRFIQPPVDFNQRQCLPERVGGENEVDSLHTALYHVTPCMRGVGGMSDCFNILLHYLWNRPTFLCTMKCQFSIILGVFHAKNFIRL